jgi:hypothetical protein
MKKRVKEVAGWVTAYELRNPNMSFADVVVKLEADELITSAEAEQLTKEHNEK